MFPGPANLSIGPIDPAGPNRTIATSTTSSHPGSTPTWIAEFFAFDDQVGKEDTVLVESVHRGMASGLLEEGRLLLNAEPLLPRSSVGWASSSALHKIALPLSS